MFFVKTQEGHHPPCGKAGGQIYLSSKKYPDSLFTGMRLKKFLKDLASVKIF
jgi:hypothetical protein